MNNSTQSQSTQQQSQSQSGRGQSSSFHPEKKCFIKVVAIGDSGVGKTSIIQMFENSKFTENFKPTIGADFSNKEIQVNGRIVTLQIWDTAGQERYQSLGTAFYRGADCCLLVYDVTNLQSFENVVNWKNSFLGKSMVINPETFPFMVVGNKIDLESDRQVGTEQGKRVCQDNGDMLFIEASARTNVNVEQAFIKLAEQALKRQDDMQKQMDETILNRKAQERERNKRLGRPDRKNPPKQDNGCQSC